MTQDMPECCREGISRNPCRCVRCDANEARREQLREQQIQAEEFVLKDYAISESERVEMETLLEIANERIKDANAPEEQLSLLPPPAYLPPPPLPPIPRRRRGQVQPQGDKPLPYPSERVAIHHAAMQNEQTIESMGDGLPMRALIEHFTEKQEHMTKLPFLEYLPTDNAADERIAELRAKQPPEKVRAMTEKSPDWHGGDNCSFHPLPDGNIGRGSHISDSQVDALVEQIKHELEKAMEGGDSWRMPVYDDAKTSHDQPPPKVNTHEPLWPAVISDISAMLFISPNAPTDSLLDRVTDDMHERDAVGRERYGTPLQPFNGRDPIRDAYAEALDMAVYLKQALVENTNPLSGFDLLFLYHNALGQILALRREIALRDALKKDSV